jgi:hypothetical protein
VPVCVLDESMSAWRPRTTKHGGLPHISFVMQKPEPLGTEFKTAADPATASCSRSKSRRGNPPWTRCVRGWGVR